MDWHSISAIETAEKLSLPLLPLRGAVAFPNVQIVLEILRPSSLRAFGEAVTADCERYLDESRSPDREWARTVYMLDALLLSTCNEN